MRLEVHMTSGHLFWAKHRLAGEMIDLEALFNDYLSSSKHEFMVLSQS